MKRFIEFKIESNEDLLIGLLDKLKSSGSTKWTFEKKLTKDYASNISIIEPKVACFKANLAKYFESTIWLVISENTLSVTNIVSRKIPYLGKDLYNLIVKDFYKDFVIKFIPPNAITILTSDDIAIEDLANPETAKKLIIWEAMCNHSTGNTHPYDRERWFDFIVTAVKTNSELTVGDLEQWLIEEKNWVVIDDDSLVEKIVIDFEYGIDLLKYYVGESK